jgi:hypothetical protein
MPYFGLPEITSAQEVVMKGQPQPTVMRRAQPAVNPKVLATPRRGSEFRYTVVHHQLNVPRDYFSPYAFRQ